MQMVSYGKLKFLVISIFSKKGKFQIINETNLESVQHMRDLEQLD